MQQAYKLLKHGHVKATHTENKAARRFLSGQYDSVGEDGDELCNLYTALKRAFPGRSRINPGLLSQWHKKMKIKSATSIKYWLVPKHGNSLHEELREKT